MATWKKVVVSGSSAELAALKVDNLTSGQVVIGGGQASNLSTTAINGTGNIVATSGATQVSMTGSFTGSFYGDGSQLTGVVATNPNSLISGEGITSFSYNGLTAQSVSVSGAVNLTDNAITKWDDTAGKFVTSSLSDNNTTITGLSSIQLTGTSTRLTGSFTGSHFGIFSGSFSGSGTVTSASFATTASYSISSSFVTGSIHTAGNLALSSSYAVTASYAISSSFVTGSIFVAGNLALSASNATTASYAITSSFVTGSIFVAGNFALSASYASNAGRLVNALTLGNGLTGTSYDGSSTVTAAVGAGTLTNVGVGFTSVSTSSLTTNQIPKYSANALAGSNVSDNGTTITLAGTTTNVTSDFQVNTNKFTVAASTGNTTVAGTLNVTGNTILSGDLTVAGTANFQNTQNLLVADQFILLNSGSAVFQDGGIIVANGPNFSGSAWYLETNSTGTYGRWAVTSMLHTTASAATADEYGVTAKINQGSAPSAAPTWGGATSGTGNMWITNGGDIYIYA